MERPTSSRTVFLARLMRFEEALVFFRIGCQLLHRFGLQKVYFQSDFVNICIHPVANCLDVAFLQGEDEAISLKVVFKTFCFASVLMTLHPILHRTEQIF